jgi:catechol 2,3-dioxygenase-like lactoylglutathione lyase family enzyme
MTTERMDHVGIVVDDLEEAVAFFVELGLRYRERRRSRATGWIA